MFILTVKSNRIKKVIVFTFLVSLVLFSIFTLTTINKMDSSHQTGKNISVIKNISKVKSNEDRVNFLSQFGWKVNPEPLEMVEITIPENFNSTYENYNAIQKNQGLDLSKYKVRTIKPYNMFPRTYHCENLAVLERKSS